MSAVSKPLPGSLTVDRILKVILVLNLAVLGVKLFAGLQSKSLSIIGDAVHSGIDGLNNIVAIFIISLASQPPDKDHPYGHGKFETLGALAIVAFLAIASFELVEKSIMRFFHPLNLPDVDFLTLWLLFGTLIVNIFVWAYEKNAGIRYGSELLLADAEHTWSDILITISILISTFVILKWDFYVLDPIFGIIVAAVIFRSGMQILQRTVPILVDEAWITPDDVKHIVLSIDKVAAFEDFRSRKGQGRRYVEMTVKFDTDSLTEAHHLSHEIERKILEKYGEAEVTIHIEPVMIP